MRFGIFLPSGQWPEHSPADALDRTIAAAVAAEEAGFDDVWLAEHHFMSYGVCPSATVLAGFLLGATSRITVGTAVATLSTRHPVALAEEAALLSVASGGRFALGVGRGGPWIDLEVFGTGLARFEEAFPESLDLLLACLSGETVRGRGPVFAFPEVPFVPRPRTAPGVHVACTSPATEALAAARGLPMLLGLHQSDPEKAEAVARYGSPAPHISANLAQVAESRVAAEALLAEALPRWLGPGLAGHRAIDGRPRPPRDPHAYAAGLVARGAVGTPAQCAAVLRATRETTGIGHQILLADAAGTPEAALENIARLGAEVLPLVRD
ncbi:LLM class flavin-dependent oxidoreductase [Actinocorallia longicatena]|uniref:LLM class flavin-dependent oxidoreductase n=1 Tax=Actinocorallia longicatena TaxID=111803 RepID=A0ABP6QL87_9ACTN